MSKKNMKNMKKMEKKMEMEKKMKKNSKINNEVSIIPEIIDTIKMSKKDKKNFAKCIQLLKENQLGVVVYPENLTSPECSFDWDGLPFDDELKGPEVGDLNDCFNDELTDDENYFDDDCFEDGCLDDDYFDDDSYDNIGKRMRIGEAEVHNWLANNKYRNLYEALSERVKGQEDIEKVVANVYNYLQCVDARRAHNNNMIIAAPSGCGKTETFRALRDYFRQHMPSIPVYQVDISSVTQDGFKGKNVSEIVRPLMEVAADTDGIGIVFLDEFDKKITPTYSQSEENVNLAVQSQLLTLVEGRECRELFGSIDTSRTLFIGLGSFDSVRMKKGEIVKHLGFGSKNEGGVEHFTPITRNDMINLGATYELIGRFSTVVNYHELSEDMTKEVIKHISERVGKSYGCKMNVSEEFMNFLIANRKSRYGCRLFESHIREAAFEAYMDIMRNDVDITKCEIVLINEGHSMYVLNGIDNAKNSACTDEKDAGDMKISVSKADCA